MYTTNEYLIQVDTSVDHVSDYNIKQEGKKERNNRYYEMECPLAMNIKQQMARDKYEQKQYGIFAYRMQ